MSIHPSPITGGALATARARLDALAAALEDTPVPDHLPRRQAAAPEQPATRHPADRDGWREALLSSQLPPLCRLVALVLTLGMNPAGHLGYAPGRRYLAGATGLTVGQVDDALDHLDGAGWLTVTRTERHQRPTAYQAACPTLDVAGQVS